MTMNTVSDEGRKIAWRKFIKDRAASTACLFGANAKKILRQKAFRQRKEQYVKTLERKFNELESKSNSLEEENRRLKAELASLLPVQHQPGRDVLRDSLLDEPNQDSPLSEGTLNSDGRNYIRISQDARTKLVDSDNTCQMISTVWELIQSNDLFEQREVDFVRVYEQLREIAGAQKQHFNLDDGIQKIFENAFPKEDSLL
jgi:vacuolar-type H+-ATPase subunit I/STV1